MMKYKLKSSSELPYGWEIKEVGEILKLEYGKPLDKKFRKTNGKYPIYGANGIKGRTDKFYYDKKTIIVGRKGSAGEINLSENKFWPLDVTYFVKFNKNNTDLRFFFYLFKRMELQKLAKGVKPGINRNDVYKIKIIVPPLSEQKRIVEILDNVFKSIEKAKDNAEQNLKNTQELFDSYLKGIFANPGKDWQIKKLGEVSEVIAGQSPESKYYNENGKGIPFYQGKKLFTKKYIGEPSKWTTKITKIAIKGDILMSVRAPVGPINFSTQKICIGRGLVAIRPSELLDKEYLFNYLLSKERDIVGNEGTVFNSINKKQIEEIKIPVPPMSEQKRIVEKLDELKTETKRLELVYEKKIRELEELKKSILQKAFRGEI